MYSDSPPWRQICFTLHTISCFHNCYCREFCHAVLFSCSFYCTFPDSNCIEGTINKTIKNWMYMYEEENVSLLSCEFPKRVFSILSLNVLNPLNVVTQKDAKSSLSESSVKHWFDDILFNAVLQYISSVCAFGLQ